MLLRRAFPHHRHRSSVINVLIVLICADVYMIARLKIADLCRTALRVVVFGRARGGNRGDRLVVAFDDDVIVANFPQHPDKRGGGLVVRLTSGLLPALGVPPATRISTTGKSDPGNDDLAETAAAQEETGQ